MALSEKTAPMRFLSIKLTDRCNMQCRMCGQRNNPLIPKSDELSLSQWEHFMRGLPYKELKVCLWGGEPFLFREIIKLIRIIKEKGHICAIITNGYFLKENAEQIVKSGLDYLEISVDGNAKLHDKIRNLKGAFKKIEQGLQLIRKAKAHLKSLKPLIIMCPTISSYNLPYLSSIFHSAQKLKVELLNITPLIYIPTKHGQAYQNIMKSVFGINASQWKGYEENSSVRILRSFKKALYSGLNKGWGYFTLLPCALQPERIDDYFKNYENSFNLFCKVPWNSISIQPNGDAAFCENFPDYILGNIKTNSLAEIWNNKKARQFRRFLIKNKGLPICNRCCGLFREFE